MSNIKIIVFCTFLFISLFGCDTKTDIQLETSREVKQSNPREVKQSNPNVDTVSSSTEKDEILLYKGISNWALPCLNRQLAVLGMDVVNKRIIRFYIENTSPIASPPGPQKSSPNRNRIEFPSLSSRNDATRKRVSV